jgi:AraC-like DNA-binding protein
MQRAMDGASIKVHGVDLEIAHVCRSSHVFPRHFHESLYSIGLMRLGASYCLGPGRDDATVRQDQACLFNPGQVHSCVPVSDAAVSYSMLYLHEDLIRLLVEDVSQRTLPSPEFKTLICAHPDIVASLNSLIRCLDGPCDLTRESALVRVLGDLLRMYGGVPCSSAKNDPVLVRQAKELLGADLDQKITLRDLAARLGASQYHILRAFKRQTGVPPHVFRTQRRVDRARELIRLGQPLAEVAQLTGFTDQPHFSNTFKLYTGITPGLYAQAAR